MPGIEQRQPHEVNGVGIDARRIRDPQGLRVQQAPFPMRLILEAQVEQRIRTSRRRRALRPGQRRDSPAESGGGAAPACRRPVARPCVRQIEKSMIQIAHRIQVLDR